MRDAYAVVSASELEALRSALATAIDALERLERGLIEDPLDLKSAAAGVAELFEVF